MTTSSTSISFFKGASEHRTGTVRIDDREEFLQFKENFEKQMLKVIQNSIYLPQQEFSKLLLEFAWVFEQASGYEVDGWEISHQNINYSDEVRIEKVEIIVHR